MTLVSEQRTRLFATTPSRALTYLPATALVLDLILVAGAAVVAVLGRAAPRHLRQLRPGPRHARHRRAAHGHRLAAHHRRCRRLQAERLRGRHRGVQARLQRQRRRRRAWWASGATWPGSSSAAATSSSPSRSGSPRSSLAASCSAGRSTRARRRGALLHRVLIAGGPAHIDEIASVLRREPWLGYHVVGALTPSHDLSEETAAGIPVLGNSDEATLDRRGGRAPT